MTRIDFYVLPDIDRLAALRFGCRLAAIAAGRGQRVHVHLQDDAECALFDDLLWAWPAAAFVPHAPIAADAQADGATAAVPVTLGCGDPGPHMDVLLNLHDAVPSFFNRFERVAEIVHADPHARATSREHYRFYRHRGYPLHHHEISDRP